MIIKKNYFESIDILRGFAALSVLVYHVIEHFNWQSFPATGVFVWFRIGWMGVDLFFVISGFVIGLSAFSEIDKHGNAGFRIPFMQRRLARIVPLHYLTLLIFVSFITPELLFNHFWTNLISHLFFVHNFSPIFHGAINGSNWSLGTEMQFYVLMLFAAPWVRTTRWWWLLFSCVGISWAWRYGAALLVPSNGVQGPFPLFVASTQLPGMLDEFVAGLLLARFLRSDKGVNVLSRLSGTIVGTSAVALVATLIMSVVLVLYWRYAGSYWESPVMVSMARSLLAVAFAAILFAFCVINLSTQIKKILSPLMYLGKISFGIYLWHLPVLLSLKRISWLSPDRVLPIAVCITCILAAISWHFFENPILEKSRAKSYGGFPKITTAVARHFS